MLGGNGGDLAAGLAGPGDAATPVHAAPAAGSPAVSPATNASRADAFAVACSEHSANAEPDNSQRSLRPAAAERASRRQAGERRRRERDRQPERGRRPRLLFSRA